MNLNEACQPRFSLPAPVATKKQKRPLIWQSKYVQKGFPSLMHQLEVLDISSLAKIYKASKGAFWCTQYTSYYHI
jgi:hypothetical protein